MTKLDKAELCSLAKTIQKAQAANRFSLLTQAAYGNIGMAGLAGAGGSRPGSDGEKDQGKSDFFILKSRFTY